MTLFVLQEWRYYMLQIENISKKYVTGDLVQQALKNVSLTLRDNEFVAILDLVVQVKLHC